MGETFVESLNGLGAGGSPFLSEMERHLDDGTLDLAVARVTERPELVKTHAMELIDVIMMRLMEQSGGCSAGREERLRGCISLLCAIARLANRKEALLCLLEKGEMFKEDVCFRALLPPLQIVLLREPQQRGSSLAWALSTLYTHLAGVPLPAESGLEQRERLLMYRDPAVQRHTDLLAAYTPFLRPFVQEVSPLRPQPAPPGLCPASGLRARELLCCHVLKLMDRPLSCLDLAACGQCLPPIRAHVDQLMGYISALQSNFLRLFQLLSAGRQRGQEEAQFSDDWREDQPVSSLALGTYLYLLYSQQVTLTSAPAVLCPVYLLRIGLPLCVTLLRRRELCAVLKGAGLLEALLERVQDDTLQAEELDAPAHADLSAALINVSVFSQTPELRACCVRLLTGYVRRFGSHGRYLVLRNLLNSNHNPSVLAFVIGLLKESVARALDAWPGRPCQWFSAPALTPLLRTACRLQSGATTDLLETHNQLMAALNLLRFLLARDKHDVTGVRALSDELRTSFLEPLRTALDLSRGHFRLRLRELRECPEPAESGPRLDLTVGGQLMSGMSAEQQAETVELALTTLDLIGNVLGWVGESMGAARAE